MENTTTQPDPLQIAEMMAKFHSATLPQQLMAKPALSWPEFWQDLLGIPDSTANEIVRAPNGPQFFLIGRRRFIRTSDATAWIDRIADARRYYPRANTKGRAAHDA